MFFHHVPIIRRFFRVSSQIDPKSNRVSKSEFLEMLDLMTNTLSEHRVEAGQRLRCTRIALGFRTMREFAGVMNIPETNLGKWENGEALVPTTFVQRLRATFKVTHDWIYAGDPANLPHGLAVAIAEVSNLRDEGDD